MFELTIVVNFEAAHRIPDYPGKCNRLHGHNWKVEVVVQGSKLDKLGMLVDFRELKNQVNEVILVLDHHYLNELEAFKVVNPTAENIAKYFYTHIQEKLESQVRVTSVKIWESDHSAALYRED